MRGLHQKLREQTRKQHFCRLRSRQVLPSKQRQSTCQPHAVESSNTQVLCSSLGPTKHCKCPPQPIVHSVFLRRAAQGANPSRLCLHLCNAVLLRHSRMLASQCVCCITLLLPKNAKGLVLRRLWRRKEQTFLLNGSLLA